MSPAELARIRRILDVRAAQLRMAEAAHARDRAALDAARAAERSAVTAVDEAADAAARQGVGVVVDDLEEARLRVAFLSRVAALRGKEVVAADNARQTSRKRLQASTITREQMKTWFDGAAGELRRDDDRRQEQLFDELASRRATHKEER